MKKRIIKWTVALIVIGLVYWGSYQMAHENEQPYEALWNSITSCAQVLLPSFESNEKGQADYVIVFISIIVVLYTLFYSIKHLVRPNEPKNHIKNQILDQHAD